MRGIDDPLLAQKLPPDAVATLREQVEMASGLCPGFELESFRQGHMTPVFFGSALNNFGVRELLRGVADLAPPPRPQPAAPDGPHEMRRTRKPYPALSLRYRPISTRNTATASPSCECARAASAAA